MNFLEKLDNLMIQHNLNKNSLSKACGIPYTTIDGWYKKGYDDLRLSTLKKLAAYFNTSLDYWAFDNETETNSTTSPKKQGLINLISQLDESQLNLVNRIVDSVLNESEK